MVRPLNKEQIEQKLGRLDDLRTQIAQVIVGQKTVVEEMLLSLMAGGHCIIEGVPGLAKTLMVDTLSRALELDFHRVQFTPDLMPSDIVGTEILEEDHGTGKRFFKFQKGPVFTNVLLADEINRTPPKTQSALLEAMQEHAVSYGGERYALPEPFFVLATQNPVHGTVARDCRRAGTTGGHLRWQPAAVWPAGIRRRRQSRRPRGNQSRA